MESFLVFLAAATAIDGCSSTIKNELSTNGGQNLLVEGFCYKECPDGYQQQGQSCIKTNLNIFTFKLSSEIDSDSSYKEI